MTKKEKYFRYLDKLRESGVTNMFGASPYLSRQFGLGKNEAIAVLSEWMDTFEERHAMLKQSAQTEKGK